MMEAVRWCAQLMTFPARARKTLGNVGWCGHRFVAFSGDRDTGVRVVLRARPLNSLERSKAADSLCIGIDGDSVECKVAKQDHAGTVRFSFDKVFGPDSEQKQVYDFIGPQAINGTC
jgi:hypothetical protein